MSDAAMALKPKLILASTSVYRRAALARLGLAFAAVAPEVDEAEVAEESPHRRARRLAAAKADAVAKAYPEAIVIGSDQVAALQGDVLHKPGTIQRAQAMLQRASGQKMHFFTAVCVRWGTRRYLHVDRTTCQFRALSSADIDAYLQAEPALDCAGAFKVEGLGISLFTAIRSRDPSALVGLPLIMTAHFLRELGVLSVCAAP